MSPNGTPYGTDSNPQHHYRRRQHARKQSQSRISRDPYLNPTATSNPKDRYQAATRPPLATSPTNSSFNSRKQPIQPKGLNPQGAQSAGQAYATKPKFRSKRRSVSAIHPGIHPMQQLEALDNELESSHGATGATRWLVPYADLLTLLLGLFLVLMALATQQANWLEGVTSTLMTDLEHKNQQVEQQQAELDNVKEAMAALNLELADILAPEATEPTVDANGNLLIGPEMDAADNTSFTVTQDDRGLVITLLDSVLFAPGQAELSPAAKKALDAVVKEIQPLPNDIRVEGHTDNTPIKTSDFPNNWYLSTARSTTIVEYFVKSHQFNPTRLSAAGYGQYHPVAENTTVEGKQKNRRVDIIVLNSPDIKAAGKAVANNLKHTAKPPKGASALSGAPQPASTDAGAIHQLADSSATGSPGM